jgi:squalene-hopene/tetraprenyl-beta-curcumene cyclase
MRTLRRISGLLICFLLAVPCRAADNGSNAVFASSTPAAGALNTSLRNEVDAAVGRGLDWLAANQKENGAWSNDEFPALTALALRAFAQSTHPDKAAVVAKARTYVLSCVQTNGGIYRTVPGRKGGGLSNYNTAICMTALHALRDPSLAPVILNARKFLAGSQHFGDDVYTGGFGYDRNTGRAYTDLMNTYYAAEAMKRTADVEDRRPAEQARADINWAETVKFVERMQNLPESGDENAGGFVYNPTDPKAGATTNAQGKVVLRSYGSITYAGMLALIYADVSRDDVRVRSALDWATKHWTLDENPGMGQDGLYFFYDVLANCLNAARVDRIPLKAGAEADWRAELARKLVKLQQVEPKSGRGFWVNPSGSYWENDPALVTSYALLALETL